MVYGKISYSSDTDTYLLSLLYFQRANQIFCIGRQYLKTYLFNI